MNDERHFEVEEVSAVPAPPRSWTRTGPAPGRSNADTAAPDTPPASTACA